MKMRHCLHAGLIALVICASVLSVSAQSRLSDKDVAATMKNLNNDAKKYRSEFNAAIKKSVIRHTSQEKDARALAQEFERQTGSMLQHFKSTKKADNSLPIVLTTADKLAKTAESAGVTAQLSSRWTSIRASLDKLSAAFDIHS